MSIIRGFGVLMAIALVAYFALLFLERFLGLPEVRSIAGAALFILGVYFTTGAQGGNHVPVRAKAGVIRGQEIEVVRRDSVQRFGAGVQLMIIGAAVFGLTILFVHVLP